MRLYKKQLIKSDMNKVWEFFSSPRNLQIITPKYMNFQIISELPEKMYEGLVIEYKVSPLFGIPIKWISEITHIEKHHYFIDEQKVGPYRFWHHTHLFTKTKNGVLMEDIVFYELPFTVVSNFFASFISSRVSEIFDYRFQKIEEIFNHQSKN